ncbi:hypothetical protein Enr13x_42410 [Stieleria neptunia]|uniref:Uncharacterized protein n=1 Tax=Stieleria neptunia TaxID=2527979 RepID=A0A518HU62_9BACT|nr:hypothetical protein [Stieleria neptunia]QDV44376.1 hypothetical protein Enr13x_42410 [Stieleria neptunia]
MNSYESLRGIETRLATIDARLASGIESVSTDGTSTKVNLASLRQERERLTKLRDGLVPRRTRRPVASRISLGGF